MTGSTPSDLAVTFRSVDRRLREALDGTPATDPTVAGLVAQLRAAVDSAAHLESLRASALEVGRVLRAIAEQTEHTD